MDLQWLQLAWGLYVVGGENAYRFCPKFPNINPSSIKDQIRDSQREFYALNMENIEFDLIEDGENAALQKFKIREAEADGTLEHCASVYDPENDDLVQDFDIRGPRVVDFANILKYKHIPLSETIHFLLRLFREAMGSPVEMEYAVDLKKGDEGSPTFYLLQIKPLIRHELAVPIEIGNVDSESTLMYAKRGMGNGRIDGIRDIIYVSEENFDKTKTKDIAQEISKLNDKMNVSGSEYVLIGPGRWGSRDHFTGIPVSWAQISKARIIVEMGLHDFPLDGSLGSHFFHNVTSMNIGYFTVPHNSRDAFLNSKELNEQPVIEDLKYVKHIRVKQELEILMDGRKREALIRI